MPRVDRNPDEPYRIEKIVKEVELCPVCGGRDFSFHKILWPELVSDWQLSPDEVKYINRQQGFYCVGCGNNLRSMALAAAILLTCGYSGSLAQFVASDAARTLKVLEVNEAGGLSSLLARMPHHQLVRYPEHDMTGLALDSGIFDLVVHSDTLEHVPDPVAGLAECRRVLKNTGRCVFTVPVVIGRLTRSRAGLKNSYHGSPGEAAPDQIVHSEFGADVWKFPLEAGFSSIRIHCFEYPGALAIEAGKKT
jgi:SAM-dependent methyltransferase